MKKNQIRFSQAVYEVGRTSALSIFYQVGHVRVTPSLAMKQDYGYDWKDFIDGWNDAKKEWYKTDDN